MTDSRPGAVFAAATAAITDGDVGGWLALCREDVVLEFPYAPAGRPRRVEGKADVEDYLRAIVGQVQFEQITEQRVHQTVDPDTAIVEWSVRGHVTATGAPYEMSYVVVLTLVDGLMATYRDYWDPLTVLNALA
ncbi:nuclear transport factor 2 family protein [Mycolicibacterium sp. P1-18]|uniref:nuclear transport factor 2 family protein n=1 Tax=Mycolicibacterium sp. P1-18 TaxID=2024615 RepID=UPI001564BBA1|nr:nuclear transport factor 2 family protein [Mycolicibacterium sp. P1-18]